MTMAVLHQTWKTYDVPAYMDYSRSWLKQNPGMVQRLWDDEDCRRLVANESPDLLPTYDSLPHPIMRADMFRYVVLYHLGGIYADLDVECLGPVGVLSAPGVHLIEERLHPGFTVGPYLMASSEPCHPFWKHVLHMLTYRASTLLRNWTKFDDKQQHSAILNTTGPYMLTDAWRTWPREEDSDMHLHTEASLGVKHHAVGSWWHK